jgi:hypothetical protein
VVSRNLEVVRHGLDVISVVNNHVLDRIKVDGQGVLVVESDASHFTYGRISILIGFGDKDYRIVFDKSVIMQDYSTRLYGF